VIGSTFYKRLCSGCKLCSGSSVVEGMLNKTALFEVVHEDVTYDRLFSFCGSRAVTHGCTDQQ